MTIVLARGNYRFSGETDDYPPDVTRHTKKVSKEKKSHSSSRSVDGPLVTIAEPYPKGSILAPLLNPVHKALYDTHVAISRAPGDLLYGIKPGEKVDLSRSSPKSKSRGLRDSDEESGSEDDTDSEEEGDGLTAAERRAVAHDPISLHALIQARKVEREALRGARRVEREALRGARRAERESRRDRKRERERYVQGIYYGNWDAGKEKPEKSSKHRKEESVGEIATGKFRLVVCYWDGQREVF